MTLANITLYCSQSDVERYLSASGVKLRLDHDGDDVVDADEQAAMQDALVEAAETCNFYLYQKYYPSALAASNFVNRKAMLLAAYRICSLRGNPVPDQVVEDASKAEDELKAVCDSGKLLPGVPLRRALAPVFSNTRVDPRYTFRCIRVERQQSSSQPSQLPQNTDWNDANLFEY